MTLHGYKCLSKNFFYEVNFENDPDTTWRCPSKLCHAKMSTNSTNNLQIVALKTKKGVQSSHEARLLVYKYLMKNYCGNLKFKNHYHTNVHTYFKYFVNSGLKSNKGCMKQPGSKTSRLQVPYKEFFPKTKFFNWSRHNTKVPFVAVSCTNVYK